MFSPPIARNGRNTLYFVLARWNRWTLSSLLADGELVNVRVSTWFLAHYFYIKSSIHVLLLNIDWIRVAVDGDQGLKSIEKRRVIAIVLHLGD